MISIAPANRSSLADVLTGCTQALDLEIEEAKRRPAVYDLRDGALTERQGGSYVYAFRLPFDPGAPDEVKLIVNDRTLEATYVGYDEKEEALSIMISEDFGFTIPAATLLASNWELLIKLRDQINRLPASASYRNLDFVHRLAGLTSPNPSAFPLPTVIPEAAINGLNAGQIAALDLIATNDITFVWGPPGTGKTQTMAALTLAALSAHKRLLMVAHANVAVDNLLARVVDQFESDPNFFSEGKMLRYGKTIAPAVRARFGDFYGADKVLARRDNHLQQLALAGSISALDCRRAQDLLETNLVHDSAIVVTTLTQTYLQPDLFLSNFDWVVIDEGSAANLPQAIWAASLAKEKLIISGDFRQLPPVVQSRAAESWLSLDPFESSGTRAAVDDLTNPKETLAVLSEQYRMAPDICAIVNSVSYAAHPLITAQSVLDRTDDQFPFGSSALFYVDTSDLDATRPRASAQNRSNLLHQDLIRGLAYRLRIDGYLGSLEEQLHSLGVISPYRSQARDLRKILNKDSRFGGVGWKGMASVDTAHRFQGSEVDVVILDLTDGPGGEYPHRGFLGARLPNEVGARLTNVAVSRARRHLILIGGLSYLARTLPADATTNIIARLVRELGTAIPPQDLMSAASDSALAFPSSTRPVFPPSIRRPKNFSRR